MVGQKKQTPKPQAVDARMAPSGPSTRLSAKSPMVAKIAETISSPMLPSSLTIGPAKWRITNISALT